jgi:hypothetical protein
MKIIIYLLVLGLLSFSSCNSGGSTTAPSRPKTPQELKWELERQEKSNPREYLSAKATMSPNKVKTREAGLFRDAQYKDDGYNIEGTIKNSASIARFKDVVLTVTFLSQTGTKLDEKDYVFYEFYEPNSSKGFKLHTYPPEPTKQFSVKVKDATGVD